MKHVLPLLAVLAASSAAAVVLTATEDAQAYPDYSGCANCHGGFRASPYTSLSDGQSWGDDLHDLHRQGMLNGDCNVCHSGAGRSPVYIAFGNGGLNGAMRPLSCMGCHGRTQDDNASNPGNNGKLGTGLRQHHDAAQVAAGLPTTCRGCHADANTSTSTSRYFPVSEAVLPEFYMGWSDWYAAMPDDACNPSPFLEDMGGPTQGLDNDGDQSYDMSDSDCGGTYDGTYSITFVHSGMCLAVTGASIADGANITQAACASIPSQRWTLIKKADGTYRIRAQHSNKCIRAAGGQGPGDASNGTNIQQGPCKFQRSKWAVMPLGGGEYSLRSLKTGQCAEIVNASMTNGANVQQYACGGGDQQRILLVP